MSADATLIYDGDCPFCSRFAQYTRLKQAVGDLRLIDAREGGPEVERARAAGYRLDEGLVLEIGGELYHGDACLNRLALLSSRSNFFNRLNYALFRSPRAARLAYPVLRFGRNTALRLLGRKPMGY